MRGTASKLGRAGIGLACAGPSLLSSVEAAALNRRCSGRVEEGGGALTSDSSGSRGPVIGGAIVFILAAGWFTMSHLVMQTPVPDALGEALGVALGVLMVVSVVGAIWSRRGDRETEPGDSTPPNA
jgi:hypothetical protein